MRRRHGSRLLANFFRWPELIPTFSVSFLCARLVDVRILCHWSSSTDPPGEPNVIGYEKGKELRAGEMLKLKCVSLGGYPLPNLRWIKVVQPTLEEKEISGLETKTGYSGVSSELYVRLAPSDNGATYKCLVANEAVNQPLATSVLLSPVYFANSESVQVKPGDLIKVKSEPFASDAQLMCESGECHPACNLTWFRDGVRLQTVSFSSKGGIVGLPETEEKTSLATGVHGGFKSTSRLTVRQKWTSKDDGSVFTCVSSNNFLPNKFSKNITLHVLCE